MVNKNIGEMDQSSGLSEQLAIGVPATGLESTANVQVGSKVVEVRGEIQETIDPVETEKYDALMLAMKALADGETVMQTMLLVLRNKAMSKAKKVATLEALVEMDINDPKFTNPMSDSGPALNDLAYIKKKYNFILRYKNYFGDLVDDVWYKSILRIIGVVSLRSGTIYNPANSAPPFWHAEYVSALMDLAEEINSKEPIPNFVELKQKCIAEIADILSRQVDRNYFATGHGGKVLERLTYIREQARKYKIELPIEQDVWERDVANQIEETEKQLVAMEQKLERKERMYDSGKTKDLLIRTVALLDEAIKKFPGLKLPSKYLTVRSVIDDMQARLGEAISKDIALQFEEKESRLNEAALFDDPAKIKKAIDEFEKFLRDGKSEIDPLVRQLEAIQARQETGIAALIKGIQRDLGLAAEDSDRLKQRGIVLNTVKNAIAKLRKESE